jgi:hypothetical protein
MFREETKRNQKLFEQIWQSYLYWSLYLSYTEEYEKVRKPLKIVIYLSITKGWQSYNGWYIFALINLVCPAAIWQCNIIYPPEA